MNNSFAYLPPEQRKKILLICDDIRVHSGVATVGREIVIHTAQHFNWVNIAGSIKHPEKGKRLGYYCKTNFSFEIMAEKLEAIMDANAPKKVEIKLPNIKKISLPKKND